MFKIISRVCKYYCVLPLFPQTYIHFHKRGEAVVLLQQQFVGIPYLEILTGDRWREERTTFDLSGVLDRDTHIMWHILIHVGTLLEAA